MVLDRNGVIFGADARVDVGGIIAATGDVDTNAVMAGGSIQINDISDNGTITNAGTITVHGAGLAAFVAPHVTNNGIIEARLGRVQIGAGSHATIDLYGDGLMELALDEGRTQILSNKGLIAADGGHIQIEAAAAKDIVDNLIQNTGTLKANAAGVGHAGEIILYAEGSNAVKDNKADFKGIKTGASTIIHSGTMDVSGKNAGERGGSIKVLADQIALESSSIIDASGHTGLSSTTSGQDVHAVRSGSAGGDIKIGGDYLGGGTTATAKKLYVAEGAEIKNDATHTGDAGRTIFWSDDKTQFAGTVSATSVDGTGGFVEVSGKNALGFMGTVDLRSDSGAQGTLLLDPTDITISSAASTGTMGWDGTSFTDTTTTTSNLNVTTLTNQLALSNVIVSTASALGGAGNITVDDAISWNSAFGLSLQADNNIVLNAGITNAGSGGITLIAGGDGAGNIDINNAINIDAGLGALTLTATGGQINRDVIPSSGFRFLSGTGVTINSPLVFTDYTGWNQGTNLINARTGTLTLNGPLSFANIHSGWHQLSLQGDDFAINNTISWNPGSQGGSVPISFSTFSASRQLSLAGAAGGAELSTAELDFVTKHNSLSQHFGRFATAYNTYTDQSGDVVVGARDWNPGNNWQAAFFYSSGMINVNGAQNLGGSGNITFYGDVDINAAISNAYGTAFFGKTGQMLTVGGVAGSTMVDSEDLDWLASNITHLIFDTTRASGLNLAAYSSWKQGNVNFYGAGKTHTISGAQSKTSGANTRFALGYGWGGNTNSSYIINANIDFSSAGNGNIYFGGHTSASTQLGANLTAGAGGITIEHAITLTGAANTLFTINSGTGTFAINNNATTTFGALSVNDKRLNLQADNVTLTGGISGTNGLFFRGNTGSRSIGLAGGAGLIQIDASELNLITVSSQSYGDQEGTTSASGNIDVGTYNWTNSGFVGFDTSGGTLTISGNQNFGAASAWLRAPNFDITGNLSGTGDLQFNTYGALTLGGAAGTTMIDSDELSRIQDGFSNIFIGSNAFSTTNVTLGAHSLWRDPVTINNTGNLTISGAQNIAAGSNASFTFDQRGSNRLTTISADINASGGTAGGITFSTPTNSTSTVDLGANLTSGAGGITINRGVNLTGAAGTTRGITANTGTLAINNNGSTTFGSININDKNLILNGDNMTIGGAISGTGAAYFAPHTTGLTMGLAGGAGFLSLDSSELDLITASGTKFFGQNAHGLSGFLGGNRAGNLDVGSRIWSGTNGVRFGSNSSIIVSGAQNFGNNLAHFRGNDFVINDAMSGSSIIQFLGPAGGLTIGGASGTTMLDSTELDRFQDGFSVIRFGDGGAVPYILHAYNNWRDPVELYGTSINSIVGAQLGAAGSNATFANLQTTIDVNADIDFSATTNGAITMSADTNLGANLTSGAGGITINRGVNLTGAVGTTRTINAGTGMLSINNNGATTFGSITATDKNLLAIADSVNLAGAVTSTTGNQTWRPFTDSRTVGLGTGTGDFNLTNAELALLNAGSGTLTLGSTTGTGAYNINTSHVFDEDVIFETNTGTMTLQGDISSNAQDISFATGADNFRISGNRIITANGGGNISFGGINGAVGAENLTVSALGGAITVSNAIGNVNALGAVNLQSLSSLTLNAMNAVSLFARTHGATSDITLNNILSLSGAGTALELVAGDDLINNHGAGVFNLTGGGRFLTWSDDPLEDTGEEHFSAASTKRYDRNYGADTPDPTGNIRNYSVAPTLTITPTNTQFTYGDAATVAGTYAITGWHMAEDEAAHTMGGAVSFVSSYVQGNNAGTSYSVTNSGSTLSSNLNYGISYDPSASLTVNKADLRVKAADVTFNQGGNPAVTYQYEPTDFRMGENASTAGIVGAPSFITPLNTLAVGTHNMALNLGGLSAVNYNFLEWMPRGIATVNAAPVVSVMSLPSTVMRSLQSPQIASPFNFYEPQNINVLYDYYSGQKVAEISENITLDPEILSELSLIQIERKGL